MRATSHARRAIGPGKVPGMSRPAGAWSVPGLRQMPSSVVIAIKAGEPGRVPGVPRYVNPHTRR
jgi:hypothetical protein